MKHRAFVLLQCGETVVAVDSDRVESAHTARAATEVPGAPDFVRGYVNLRGEVMPAVDLRRLLGLGSTLDETGAMISMIDQRKRDHIAWMAALEHAVRTQTEFRLALDPRRCKFGEWYHAYEATNPFLRAYLRKFEAPHGRVHALGREVVALMAEGRYRAARDHLSAARLGVLEEMCDLFHRFAGEYADAHREVMVVLSDSVALCADAALSLESLALDVDGSTGTMVPDRILVTTARREKSGEIVFVLDTEAVVRSLRVPGRR
jgi:hypothetical protein